MYLPKHFEQTDAQALHALMREHPLAALVSVLDGEPTADHVPLEFDAQTNTLRGHVARANAVWRKAAGSTVLAAFQGPQAYITPSWYPSKAATAKVVPTWNYAVVHARGKLRITEDAAWLRALVGRLTDTHEAARAHRWQVDDAPADYIEQMLRAIVGIEIEVTQLVGKWKVSQNRDAADRAGVAAGLGTLTGADARAMAALIHRAG
jgi:transcriptional regulator